MAEGAGEKTEKATPHKRQEARKQGQVLKSAEVNTAVLTMAMFATLYIFGGPLIDELKAVMVKNFDSLGTAAATDAVTMHGILVDGILSMALALWPLLLVAVVVGLVVNLAQVGFLFTGELIKPKLSKINPFKGFKRIFSMRSLVEMLKAILKISIVGLVVYQEYQKNFDIFPNMMGLTIEKAAAEIVSIVFAMAVKAVLALIALGLADYLYQWWEFEKNLKMTKQEVKQEYKLQEGDPQIKSRRRQKQREMSMMRMMQSLPDADVVITNPTHYAIALRYKESEAPAPVVLAKGKDYVAQRLKEKARELGIEIVENKPVAQALFVACEIGDEIPGDMFAAVAEILAHVYKLKNN